MISSRQSGTVKFVWGWSLIVVLNQKPKVFCRGLCDASRHYMTFIKSVTEQVRGRVDISVDFSLSD